MLCLQGECKHANSVSLWYVATDIDDTSIVLPVPSLEAEGQHSSISEKRNLVRQCTFASPKTDRGIDRKI